MRNIVEMIDQATKLKEERESLDMDMAEMKEFYISFDNFTRKNNFGDALFYLIEDVYLFGLAVGYQAGTEESK